MLYIVQIYLHIYTFTYDHTAQYSILLNLKNFKDSDSPNTKIHCEFTVLLHNTKCDETYGKKREEPIYFTQNSRSRGFYTFISQANLYLAMTDRCASFEVHIKNFKVEH